MRTTTVVIGGGHAGLAMSRRLSELAVDHVVLERGEVAHAWRTQRWDSLRLLTPTWQSRLPGVRHGDEDPHGYRTMGETVDFIAGYAAAIGAPVHAHTRVISVRAVDGGYRVVSDRGTWRCRSVVLATGACAVPRVPAVAAGVPAGVVFLTPDRYRNPDALPPGGVLVVGASASGVQIAEELQRSGRPVTLAVGEHVRVPRLYRGLDILGWMDAVGVLGETWEEADNVDRVRGLPSLQLAGTDDRRDMDLNALSDQGVRLRGRLVALADGKGQFSGSLPNQCALADLKLGRLLDRIDQWCAERGLEDRLPPAVRPAPTRVEAAPPLAIDLVDEGIHTVVWATGFRPDYRWLDVPVLDRKGRLRHEGGVVEAPGIYALGLPFLRSRKSTLIDGAGDDAAALAGHLRTWLDGSGTPRRAEALAAG